MAPGTAPCTEQTWREKRALGLTLLISCRSTSSDFSTAAVHSPSPWLIFSLMTVSLGATCSSSKAVTADATVSSVCSATVATIDVCNPSRSCTSASCFSSSIAASDTGPAACAAPTSSVSASVSVALAPDAPASATVAAACVILAASSRASSAKSSECADMPLLAKRDAPSDSSSPAAPALGAALLWPSAKAVVMLL